MKEQREEAGWTEGVAIWVAVFVVSFVGRGFRPAINDVYGCRRNFNQGTHFDGLRVTQCLL